MLPGSEFPLGQDSCCYDWPRSTPRGRAIATAQAKEAAWRAAHPTLEDLKRRRHIEELRYLDSLNRVRTGGEMTVGDYIVAKFYTTNDDCDGNGIEDSLDIASGAADDANGNWIIDACDSNETIYRETLAARWRGAQQVRDSVFFRAHFLEIQLVEIDYTLWAPLAHVDARVRNERGRSVATLLDAKRPCGAYTILWNRLDNQGRAVPPGRYWVELRVDDRRFRRPVQWR